MFSRIFAAALALFFLPATTVGDPAAAGSPLPEGFVRLSEIAPDIRQDMRYASAQNCTGQRVPGYHASVCILARPVAEALKRVQTKLVPQGLSLVVLDCYRPRRAVEAFLSWAQKPDITEQSTKYYPRISKRDLVRLGYVAAHSVHSKGVAVDLTIARIGPEAPQPIEEGRASDGPCNVAGAERHPPGALDMGTSFDCFDEASHTRYPGLGPSAKTHRALLLKAMGAEGFRNYAREWWHFSLPVAGYEKAMDFPVD
jgi:D-alanyl-D-alanine dipeptidase